RYSRFINQGPCPKRCPESPSHAGLSTDKNVPTYSQTLIVETSGRILLSPKQDILVKQWMEREKTAVDYARTRDKRIAELEADVARLHAELRVHEAAESRKALLERQHEAATALGT